MCARTGIMSCEGETNHLPARSMTTPFRGTMIDREDNLWPITAKVAPTRTSTNVGGCHWEHIERTGTLARGEGHVSVPPPLRWGDTGSPEGLAPGT